MSRPANKTSNAGAAEQSQQRKTTRTCHWIDPTTNINLLQKTRQVSIRSYCFMEGGRPPRTTTTSTSTATAITTTNASNARRPCRFYETPPTPRTPSLLESTMTPPLPQQQQPQPQNSCEELSSSCPSVQTPPLCVDTEDLKTLSCTTTPAWHPNKTTIAREMVPIAATVATRNNKKTGKNDSTDNYRTILESCHLPLSSPQTSQTYLPPQQQSRSPTPPVESSSSSSSELFDSDDELPLSKLMCIVQAKRSTGKAKGEESVYSVGTTNKPMTSSSPSASDTTTDNDIKEIEAADDPIEVVNGTNNDNETVLDSEKEMRPTPFSAVAAATTISIRAAAAASVASRNDDDTMPPTPPVLPAQESQFQRATPSLDTLHRPPLPPLKAPRKEMTTKGLATATTFAVRNTEDHNSQNPSLWNQSYPSTSTTHNQPNCEIATTTTTTTDKKTKKPLAQLFLDFGQRSFGQRTLCDICGMLYDKRLTEDVHEHDKICRNYALGVPFQNQDGRIVARFPVKVAVANIGGGCGATGTGAGTGDCIVEIRPGDASSLLKKLEQVQRVVDQELGAAPRDVTNVTASTDSTCTRDPILQPPAPKKRRRQGPSPFCTTDKKGTMSTTHNDNNTHTTAYLYIREKRIVGMATAEIISHAYRAKNQWERDITPQTAKIGIRHLWVHSRARKSGIATRLVDAVRCKLIFGWVVPKALLAFSSPTQSGHAFAKYYCFDNDNSSDSDGDDGDNHDGDDETAADEKNILVYQASTTNTTTTGRTDRWD